MFKIINFIIVLVSLMNISLIFIFKSIKLFKEYLSTSLIFKSIVDFKLNKDYICTGSYPISWSTQIINGLRTKRLICCVSNYFLLYSLDLSFTMLVFGRFDNLPLYNMIALGNHIKHSFFRSIVFILYLKKLSS